MTSRCATDRFRPWTGSRSPRTPVSSWPCSVPTGPARPAPSSRSRATAGRQVMRSIVRRLRDEGVCVLLTTHDLEDAERLADRVLIVDRGHLVASGTPAELMTASAGEDIRFGAPSGLDITSLGARLGAA